MVNQPQLGMGIKDILRHQRQAIIELAARYGVSNVRVFGSVARGEATPNSDVDLLVSFPPERIIFDLIGLWLDLKDLIGRDVSLIPDTLEDERFMQQVLKDTIPL